MSAATLKPVNEAFRIDSQSVALSFSKAASSYDAVASVQRDIAQHLMTFVELPKTAICLDLGCGTGYLMHQLARHSHQWVGADVASGMLVEAKKRQWPIDPKWVTANAENLPFGNEQFDAIVSSMALQWVNHPQQTMAEIKRVLKAKGHAYLAILRHDSLHELHQGWESLQQGFRVNRFAGREEWIMAAQQSGLSIQNVSSQSFLTLHSSLRTLLHSIKDIGAGATAVTKSGLTPDVSRQAPRITKRDLAQLNRWWLQNYSVGEQLSLTYKVDFFHFCR